MAETKKKTQQTKSQGKAATQKAAPKKTSEQKNKTKQSPAPQPKKESTFWPQAAPYILSLVAVFVAILVIIGEGNVGGPIKGVLTGIFGWCAYILPLFILIRGLLYKRDTEEGQCTGRTVCTVIVFVLIASLFHVFALGEDTIDVARDYRQGQAMAGGGVVGGFVGSLMLMGFGKIATVIIVITAAVLLSLYVAGITPRGAFIYIAYKIKFAHEKRDERRALREEKRRAAEHSPSRIKEEEYLEYLRHKRKAEAEEETEEETPKTEKKEKKKTETKPTVYRVTKNKRASKIDFEDSEEDEDSIPEDMPENYVNSPANPNAGQPEQVDITDGAVDEKIFDEVMRRTVERVEKSRRASEAAAESASAQAETAQAESEYDVSKLFTNPEGAEMIDKLSAAYKNPLEVKRETVSSLPATQKSITKTAPEYKFPPIEILQEDPGVGDTDIKSELQENAVKLVETLKSFNVKTKIENISRGPTITRYELLPAPGTRVRSIVNLVDDISLNLATSGVRIEAPIPGKSAVGIEVPNKNQSMVHLRTLIEDSRFIEAKSKLTVCLGENVAGEAIYFDIAKMPHMLIAGCTGSGKSVCINSIITSLLYKASPEDVKLILIDPKKVELNLYNGIPHLLVPVVTEPKKAAGALSWAVNEMERRFGLMEEVGAREIKNYNKTIKNHPEYEYLPRIVIVIDELADLMMTAPDDVESSICRIAQKARAAGMHLIVGTQRPSVDVITGLIKSNIPSRIAFRTSSQIDSRTIIDIGAAANLIGSGDMLFNPVGAQKPLRVQGAYVSEDDVEEVVKYVKNMNGAESSYSDEVVNLIERESQKCGVKKGGGGAADNSDEGAAEDDPMLKSAIELAIESGKISTSLIQRRLSLGYGRAAKLIDRMERLGYVSAPDGQKPRDVIITKQQYMEMRLKDEAPFDT